MDAVITFFAEGTPKAQPRIKAYHRPGMRHAGVYTPDTANDWKTRVAIEARQHRPRVPLDCPLIVDLCFLMPRPAKYMRKKDPIGTFPHTAKPDLDNLDKAVLDVLTDCGMWVDDCQAYCGRREKWYVAKPGYASDRPGVLVTIRYAAVTAAETKETK